MQEEGALSTVCFNKQERHPRSLTFFSIAHGSIIQVTFEHFVQVWKYHEPPASLVYRSIVYNLAAFLLDSKCSLTRCESNSSNHTFSDPGFTV